MSELQQLLSDFRESDNKIWFLCDISTKFKKIWEESDRINIKHKAECFIFESKIDLVYVYSSNAKDASLFLTSNRVSVRIAFLEWCIDKGHETINDLFV